MHHNGVDPRQIDPGYRRVFSGWLDEQIAAAADEQAELLILNRLAAQMESGQLIIDERGRRHALAGAPAYSEAVVAARLQTLRRETGSSRRDKAVGVLLLVAAALLLFFALGGWNFLSAALSAEETAALAAETPLTEEEAALLDAESPAPTPPPLRESALELSDSLGGRIRLGQPRTLEIRRAGQSVGTTLVIAPAQVDDKGVIGYFPPDDAAAETAAVWVFGTAINYVFGIPEEAARQLQPGDTVVMRSATGAVYDFAIVETFLAEPQQVEIFSQRQSPGATFFALPASDQPIPAARAVYLAANEELTGLSGLAAVGERLVVGGQALTVTAVTVDEGLDGLLSVRVSGELAGEERAGGRQPLLLSLLTPAGQYGALSGGQLAAQTETTSWTAVWELPTGFLFGSARLRVASLYDQAATVELGGMALPGAGLSATVTEAAWEERRGELRLSLLVANNGGGVARLAASQIIVTQHGGEIAYTIDPYLPILLAPGSETVLTVRVRPPLPGDPLIVQVGAQRWEATIEPLPSPQADE
jgi:hypothetical protein